MFRALPLLVLAAVAGSSSAQAPPGKEYLDFVKKQAAGLRAKDKPPATKEEWKARSDELRKNLLAAWGGFPAEKCPLDPQTHAALPRDGYTIEAVSFQTRPGVRMTANV